VADRGPGASAGAILLSAGEASGDMHGGTLCRELARLAPGLPLVGMGGARMAAAGVEIVADPTRHAVMGTTEAVGGLPALWRAYRLLVRRIRQDRPRALVLIDFPDFNLRLARQAARAGVPVVYYIPPQVWAWRRWRLRAMRRLVSLVLAVFPFERALYEESGVPVEYVGHPLLDVVPRDLPRDEARRRLGLPADVPVIGLFPGSRRQETERLLPAMADAATRLRREHPTARILLGRAPTVDAARVDALLAAGGDGRVEVRPGSHELMAASDLLLIASGTATLEAALLGTPMVVCYRVSRTTEVTVRLLVHVPRYSLPNILGGREVVREVLQDDVTGERLADEARRLLGPSEAADAQRRAFAEIRDGLGKEGVASRAAAAVLRAARAS
jgi:lipid-A-disaccharide synthase